MTRILIIFICFLTTLSFGQYSAQNKADRDIKAFGGMYYDLSSVRQILTHGIGGRGAVVVNKKWIVGGFAQANLALNFDYKYLGVPARIYTGQGGLWLGRFLFVDKAWNVAASATFSGGGFGSEVRISAPNEPLRTADAYSTEFFQCAPQMDVFVKITPQIKLSATLGYRFTLGMKYNPVVNNTQMNSVFTQVGFVIGRF